MLVLSLDSLPCRRFYGSSYFVPPHKRLLNRRQHSFPTLSQSRCTFQILESWPWLQGNPITTRSAWNFENLKPSWPLINVRLRAAKVRFTHHASHQASKNNVHLSECYVLSRKIWKDWWIIRWCRLQILTPFVVDPHWNMSSVFGMSRSTNSVFWKRR